MFHEKSKNVNNLFHALAPGYARFAEPSSGASALLGFRIPRSKPRGYSHRTSLRRALRCAEPLGFR
ncbi:MAG: hypothetical protein ACI391_04215 [Muribaculaceae bacterium]